MYPLVKTEHFCEDNNDDRPQVLTKEVPFTATELAKLRKDLVSAPRESETEYVWRVSLSAGWNFVVRERSRRIVGFGFVPNYR